jgi:hypothetical protein
MYKIILQCVFGATHDRGSCGYADVIVQVLVLTDDIVNIKYFGFTFS